MNKEHCPTCGQNITPHWESVTKGLVNTLIKFARTVRIKNRNKVHLQKECGFTYNQYNNFQKLRYHGLVGKVIENGEHISGYWMLTKLGYLFLVGETAIPKKISIHQKMVMDTSDKMVTIEEVYKDETIPYFEKIGDFEYEGKAQPPLI